MTRTCDCCALVEDARTFPAHRHAGMHGKPMVYFNVIIFRLVEHSKILI